ncbi:four helix bundle protein [Muricauda sp. SCSIO 64092]|uniref:four helix bundle protein n=1 Tax=Allomuricauda sp. SCSIO 64092 TaxID=2908842 RepID=UPI001FF6969E|nr:four helix bundle protein [Muricauda sp. SCSIO 64092]UOY09078.1 four helix bundle protein [Muricauda sp. SCSIO 64092]
MPIKKYDLEDRLVVFAAQVAKFCKDLPNDITGQYYGNQLLRSGGSSALNFGEAQGTYSNKDYIYKASISLKELKESRVNLKILNKIGYGQDIGRTELLNEAEQLIKIIATIIKNKRQD